MGMRPGLTERLEVTEAARELHYSQPTVTHHLARLEAQTDAQLVQRVGRGSMPPDHQVGVGAHAADVVGATHDDVLGGELGEQLLDLRRLGGPVGVAAQHEGDAVADLAEHQRQREL